MKRPSCLPVGLKCLLCPGVGAAGSHSAVMARAAGARRSDPVGVLACGLQLHADQFELVGLLEEDILKQDDWRHLLLYSPGTGESQNG